MSVAVVHELELAVVDVLFKFRVVLCKTQLLYIYIYIYVCVCVCVFVKGTCTERENE